MVKFKVEINVYQIKWTKLEGGKKFIVNTDKYMKNYLNLINFIYDVDFFTHHK